jgi:hypothetical protein
MWRNGRLSGASLVLVAASIGVTGSAQAVRQQDNGYIEPAVCATCHPKEAETYRLTGMARSFYKPDPSNQIENYGRGLPYYHEASVTDYDMAVRDGRYYHTQYQIGFDGKRTNFLEKQIDYIVGSGNHAGTPKLPHLMVARCGSRQTRCDDTAPDGSAACRAQSGPLSFRPRVSRWFSPGSLRVTPRTSHPQACLPAEAQDRVWDHCAGCVP